eukprot:CAMPEP_0202017340 /NCGR_PEP_ID=MMETSP0905-20130828/36735_1 /ASSEMBLY_ACC=CAM_ASM_000554 /TAXON_ID=420261 /ORGANISM="Thalassiosira antarctica, Strain CCMP982" /LENGTH=72 /DNA_ID=CAMNT_0048577965 /DNA_START=37 /DNA_END=255 /DNA_ORIENTATION=-
MPDSLFNGGDDDAMVSTAASEMNETPVSDPSFGKGDVVSVDTSISCSAAGGETTLPASSSLAAGCDALGGVT